MPLITNPKGAKPTDNINVDLQKESDNIRKSIGKREQGPTAQEQSSSLANWKQLADQLGEPYDVERIPIKKLRQMRRDAMIAFALHYTKTPLVRANWRIDAVGVDGPNPQVAAFVDAALRPVYARLLFQALNMLDFGFSAVVKRFKFEIPAGSYVDENGNEAPIWSEGSIEPVVYKTFLALEPNKVEPAWDKKTGEFIGIKSESSSAAAASVLSSGGGSGGDEKPNIDLQHALWFTNEKDTVFGSLFGYPRIAYAYRYWWSYWFRWAMADRYFERTAVPPLKARYPQGEFLDEDGERYDNQDLIMEAAQALRSGGIAAIPSDKISNLDRTDSAYEWDLEYLTGGEIRGDLYQEFNHLDILKIRSIFLPEQAVMEGAGASSSRNVAEQMGNIFHESQTNLMAEIDDHINRFVIPQLVVLNFPEFQGRVEKVTTGFGTEDLTFMKQIVQLVGQENPLDLGVDIPAAMERIGLPLLSAQAREEQKAELAAQVAAAQPAANPNPGPGETGVGALFSDGELRYFKPRETFSLNLSDSEEFIGNLPNTKPFKDQSIKSNSLTIKKLFGGFYQQMYYDFGQVLAKQDDASIYLADGEPDEGNLSAGEAALIAGVGLTAIEAEKAAERIVSAWTLPAKVVASTGEALGSVIASILTRAGIRESVELGADPTRMENEDEWASDRATFTMSSVEETIREQLKTFLMAELEKGTTSEDLKEKYLEHFNNFHDWQSSRVARSETIEAYNTATLDVGNQIGVKSVQISDASDGQDFDTDADCRQRNGKVVSTEDALKTVKREHPNCTLYFKLVPPDITLAVEEQPDLGDADGRLAFYDAASSTVFLSDDLDEDQKIGFTDEVVRRLRETWTTDQTTESE